MIVNLVDSSHNCSLRPDVKVRMRENGIDKDVLDISQKHAGMYVFHPQTGFLSPENVHI